MPAIAREREGQFLLLFLLFFASTLGVVVWYEIGHETADDGWDTAIAIGIGMSYCVVISSAWAYVLVEVVEMLAEQFKKKRFDAGVEVGEVRGEIRGIEKGRAVERLERDALWEAWLERQQAAQSRGEPFDEPPPSRNGNANANHD